MATAYTPVDFKNRISATGVNFNVLSKAISATEAINGESSYWQNLSAAVTQDVVLPDATTLQNGWSVVIKASGAAGLNIKTYHMTTPVLLLSLSATKVYEFVLLDNSTAAGVWQKIVKLDSEQSKAAFFTQAFNDTSDWTLNGGVYEIIIPVSTHMKGDIVDAKAWRDNGAEYELGTIADVRVVKATGAVRLVATSIPDNRFTGLLFIQ